MVGDRYSDVETAHNAGIPFALVQTGDGRITEDKCRTDEVMPTITVPDLAHAVDEILTRRSAT